MNGGTGADTIHSHWVTDSRIDPADRTDTNPFSHYAITDFGNDTAFDVLNGGDGADHIEAVQGDHLSGNAGNDGLVLMLPVVDGGPSSFLDGGGGVDVAAVNLGDISEAVTVFASVGQHRIARRRHSPGHRATATRYRVGR